MSEQRRQRKPYTKHGLSKTRTYKSWLAMIDRCTNPKHPHFHRYGGRGITVCAQWSSSFLSFLADVGHRPTRNHQLDRRENDQGYAPGNVRWVTPAQNSINRSANRIVIVGGTAKTLREWSNETGLKFTTLRMRLERGWLPEEAVSRGARKYGADHV